MEERIFFRDWLTTSVPCYVMNDTCNFVKSNPDHNHSALPTKIHSHGSDSRKQARFAITDRYHPPTQADTEYLNKLHV
jgi:hypothetical protein